MRPTLTIALAGLRLAVVPLAARTVPAARTEPALMKWGLWPQPPEALPDRSAFISAGRRRQHLQFSQQIKRLARGDRIDIDRRQPVTQRIAGRRCRGGAE